MKQHVNKLIGGIALSSFLIAGMSAFNADAHPGGKRAMANKHLIKMFNKLDTDNSGNLMVEELTQGALDKTERRFSRKDADDDGFLTFSEAHRGNDDPIDLSEYADEIVACMADLASQRENSLIIVPDADKFISPEARFANADTDGDELISLDEAQAVSQERAMKAFEQMDRDQNGLIIFQEFKAGKKQGMATKRALRMCIMDVSDEPVV